MDTFDTRNPCIKVCRFDAAGQCIACLRTRTEVKQWKRLPDATKAAINERLRAQGGVVKLKTGKKKAGEKKAAKRLKKLDKKIRKLEAKLDALRAERAGLGGTPLLDAAE